ncbi:hypothetical protein LEP1GSC005_3410 [Leptospira santarosai str. ST188]|uniref:Uncharacterized protein n=2 Tax=Leptospira santarosai TaxID=28183 RepID=A0A0E2BGP4_9LEPT|nr:hypothetical protein B2G51_16670 [Leptospira santarosai]EKO34533.1 hypothetical protein LEP1GSC179_3423 [Leptospira santarosai str. MOR084]EKO80007.1 hypothetical protein LEP1GSC068_2469 [Leptospira sp. Fiocruz LV3954]EMF90664.1 hypothetical protein LEP1GSC005_3410 [Leptospira santarosai str. ST188]EMI67437.1 hypothetical protein LEP1GSC076_1033 [Leptospira sp. Fiocruz LV4135]EMN22763.1 hypothetical protein LEP1GSC063_1696 [Leptospira santarosai serovar Arenal str. MAVJ 401]EMO71228.1 hypo
MDRGFGNIRLFKILSSLVVMRLFKLKRQTRRINIKVKLVIFQTSPVWNLTDPTNHFKNTLNMSQNLERISFSHSIYS